MAGMKGMTHYPMAMKLEAVRLHQEEGLTYAKVAERLGIRQVALIKSWKRTYQQEVV